MSLRRRERRSTWDKDIRRMELYALWALLPGSVFAFALAVIGGG